MKSRPEGGQAEAPTGYILTGRGSVYLWRYLTRNALIRRLSLAANRAPRHTFILALENRSMGIAINCPKIRGSALICRDERRDPDERVCEKAN